MNDIKFSINRSFITNSLILVFIIFVVNNFFQNKYGNDEKLKNLNLQKIVSNELDSGERYSHIIDRECKITGDMHDRHKVRWVRAVVHQKFSEITQVFGKSAPYYFEIIIHSLFIFLSLFVLKKNFPIDEKYSLFYLLFITFIFQQALGEYSYSILDMMFISLCLLASKMRNLIFFIIVCCLAIMNRETGFLALFTWLIFNNNDYKKFIIISICVLSLFILINFDILSCILKPKFFAPLEYQQGQINYSDLLNANIVSIIKVLSLNYIIPFGLGFYIYMKTKNKNKQLLIIFLIYLLTFIIASPVHKMELKMLLLPYLWTFIYFKDKKFKRS